MGDAGSLFIKCCTGGIVGLCVRVQRYNIVNTAYKKAVMIMHSFRILTTEEIHTTLANKQRLQNSNYGIRKNKNY